MEAELVFYNAAMPSYLEMSVCKPRLNCICLFCYVGLDDFWCSYHAGCVCALDIEGLDHDHQERHVKDVLFE